MISNSEWFLLGALCILFLYFITYYLTKPSEKYNLYFAIGCLISIVRTVSYNLIDVIDASSIYSMLNIKIDHLSFIWGPFLYILLADSLFPRIGKKTILRILLILDNNHERVYYFCADRTFSLLYSVRLYYFGQHHLCHGYLYLCADPKKTIFRTDLYC